MTRADAGQRQAGFTLLEIIVALVVLGFLMAGLAQGVQFGVRAWNNQSANVIRNADLDTTDRTLRTLIARMQPPALPDQPSLRGTPDTMQFIAQMPLGAPIGPGRLAEIGLLVADHRLVLRWRHAPHGRPLGPPTVARDDVLLADVASLTLSYRNRAGAWSASWSTPALPQLIRIHVVFAGATPRRWPDILVAPMRDSISETGE